MKQVVVVNKALKMKKGKLNAQVGHGQMAFLTTIIRNNSVKYDENNYKTEFLIDKDLYENWIDGAFTKIVVYAEDENHMNELIEKAKTLGLQEKDDYFKINDNGLTVFNGKPTWTVIGFKPMKREIIDKITGKLQLM